MPPKRKVKAGKMDARKTREPVSNHPTPIPPTETETAATDAMFEALGEVLTTPHPAATRKESEQRQKYETEWEEKIAAQREKNGTEWEEKVAAFAARFSTATPTAEPVHDDHDHDGLNPPLSDPSSPFSVELAPPLT